MYLIIEFKTKISINTKREFFKCDLHVTTGLRHDLGQVTRQKIAAADKILTRFMAN